MKKLISFLFVSIILLISCNKDKTNENANFDNLIYHESIPGGCALGFDSLRQYNLFEPDTVIYKINSDSLSIFVGFNVSCGPDYASTAKISSDTIYMYLNRNEGPFASCMCYYTYNFQFSGIQQSYYYIVNIDDWKFFNGYIKYLPE